jgi:multidrug resistance efflux pump
MVRRRIVALAIASVLLPIGLLHRTDRVVRADGRLAPKRWAEIRADGPGEVRARLKRRGESVRANEAVALLTLDGEEAAVAAAESDLAAARRQFNSVARQLDRMAEHSVVVPPPSVLDLGAWLEEEVRRHAATGGLVAGATARMRSIRTELQGRAERIRKRDAPTKTIGGRLAPAETQILDTLRRGLSLDQAMARYEDAIFEDLCDLAKVPPPVVRDVFAARGAGEPGQLQGAGGLRNSDGYFDLQSELRRTQLELRQLEAETANFARLREVFPALAGERHGERKALRQALEEFVARSQEARRQRQDGLGADGERLRADIHRIGRDLLDGVDQAWARIDEGPGSGLADLEHQVSQLHLSFSALERALDRQLSAFSSHSQGLIGRNALEDQSAGSEQQASLFLDAAARLRISAEELFGKRVGEVELAVAQKRGGLDLVRARLRQAMAAADEPHPLETTRARYASTVARAEWAFEAAKRALEAKVVRAPMDGVITSIGLQERTTLARNEVAGVVEDLDGLVFKALVPERELSDVRVGQRVHLSIDEDVDNHRQAVEGSVSWIGRGGQVVEKDQHPWNVLVAVEGTHAGLMPALLGQAQIVVGKSTGLERLRRLMRPSPAQARRYLDPELPDPTRVLRLRPEPKPSGDQHDSLATSLIRLFEPRGD